MLSDPPQQQAKIMIYQIIAMVEGVEDDLRIAISTAKDNDKKDTKKTTT